MILGWVGFLEFLRRIWKVIIIMQWSLPSSALGNVLVLAVFVLLAFVSDFGFYRRQTSQQGTILVPGLVALKPSRTRTSRPIFSSWSSRTTFRVTSSYLL